MTMDMDVPCAEGAEVQSLAAVAHQPPAPPCSSTEPAHAPPQSATDPAAALASHHPPPTVPSDSTSDRSALPATDPTDGKRRRVASPSPPPSPPATQPPLSLDLLAAQLSAVTSTVSATLSDMQSSSDDTMPLTQHQARSVLQALSVGLVTLLETIRTLSQGPPHATTSMHPLPNPTPPSPSPLPAHPSPSPTPDFPPLSRSHNLDTAQQRPQYRSGANPGPCAPQPNAPTSRVLSYADRLRSLHQTAEGESRRRLAGRILVAPPPMQRRLIPLAREPQSRMASELAQMRAVYVRGLLRMSFREMRGYLQDLSPQLSSRSIVSISYFGPLTSFICSDEPTAATLIAALTAAGGRVDPLFRPWLPLRRDQQDDAHAKQLAEEAFCRRVASEIIASPNLLLATFLQRHLAPHLAQSISSFVRSGPLSHRPAARTPSSVAAPTGHAPSPCPHTDANVAQPSAPSSSLAAVAASTSAPAGVGVAAEGTA